jgi:hypothetical protein
MRNCGSPPEKQGKVEQTFEGGPFIKRPRWLLDPAGNIAEPTKD